LGKKTIQSLRAGFFLLIEKIKKSEKRKIPKGAKRGVAGRQRRKPRRGLSKVFQEKNFHFSPPVFMSNNQPQTLLTLFAHLEKNLTKIRTLANAKKNK
jgi:hypothetical protein